MKRINFLMMLLFVTTMSVVFTGCKKDEKEDLVIPPTPTLSLADQAAGTYVGQLKLGSQVIQDAYAVQVTKLNDTSVKVSANFLSEATNFNLTQGANQINFVNSTLSYVTIYVTGTTLNASFLNKNNTMTTFMGNK